MQRHHAVAANCIGSGECRFGGAQSVGIAVPHKAITGGHRLRTRCAVVDYQIECVHLRTDAVAVSFVVEIGATGCINLTIPLETVACHLMIGCRSIAIDNQMEGVGAGTTGIVSVFVGVFPTGRIGNIVPFKTVTCCLIYNLMTTVIYCEVERDDAVAADLILL